MRRLILVLALVLLTSCSVKFVRTYEFRPGVSHEMPSQQDIAITVVYMDRDEIHEVARQIYERDGIPFKPPSRFYGLFDYKTRTLYCEKWDAELCGHELFHATDGDWHY